jgi:hypothetical protein
MNELLEKLLIEQDDDFEDLFQSVSNEEAAKRIIQSEDWDDMKHDFLLELEAMDPNEVMEIYMEHIGDDADVRSEAANQLISDIEQEDYRTLFMIIDELETSGIINFTAADILSDTSVFDDFRNLDDEMLALIGLEQGSF